METACIALGSNLGDREENLRLAVEGIGALSGTQLVATSDFFSAVPVDSPAGSPDFLNAAVVVETNLSADDLLRALLEIERQLGRRRDSAIPNAPRPIDLDLLLYGDSIIRTSTLTVPHPRMHMRLFVLEPLAQIAANFRHPEFKCSIRELFEDLLRANASHD